MLLLLAEDDQKIAKLLIHLLSKDGYQVDHASDGEEALDYVQSNHYDGIILDWMMPVLSGVEVCTKLRSQGYNGGILMLTAKDALKDKVEGLDAGADDYLIKPFEYQELHARIKSLLRRSSGRIIQDEVQLGNISINKTGKTVLINGQNLNLSNREYLLFELLADNRNMVVTRALIIDKVWGLDGEISENNLDAFIKLLRKKIEKITSQKMIHNVRGIGYKLEA